MEYFFTKVLEIPRMFILGNTELLKASLISAMEIKENKSNLLKVNNK